MPPRSAGLASPSTRSRRPRSADGERVAVLVELDPLAGEQTEELLPSARLFGFQNERAAIACSIVVIASSALTQEGRAAAPSRAAYLVAAGRLGEHERTACEW